MEHQSRASCSLPWLSSSSQPQPICFPRLWQLLLCRSCAANGTHWYCSYWYSRGGTWECDTCAGEAIGKRQRAACRGTGARQGLAMGAQGGLATVSVPHGGWQPVLPWGWRFILLTFLSLPTASRRNYDLGIPSTSSQMAPGPSPAAAPRKHPRQRGTGRTRSRSPLQGRASGSQSRPRRHCGGSHATTPGAQRSTRTSAAPARPRSSRASPLPARRRQSRQRGRAHTRSRSPVGRRASTSRSRPRGGRGSRSRQRGPARARSRSRAQHHRRPPRSRSRRWR